jgi:hypothetical protein
VIVYLAHKDIHAVKMSMLDVSDNLVHCCPYPSLLSTSAVSSSTLAIDFSRIL